MDRERGHLQQNPQKVVDSLVWFKVVGVGNTAVGKTCLIKHFCESKFTPGYQPTVGVDYGFKIHNVNTTDVRVHLWDLSGSPDYLDVRNELYGGTDAIFLVYDVTNQASFESLDIWMRELAKYGSGSPEMCLVANKIDTKSKRAISTGDGRKWANNNKMGYFETSCSTGEGVEKMFSELLKSTSMKKSKETEKI